MVSMDVVQHALVTLAAVGAGAHLFRRLSGVARPASTPGCAKCPSAPGACHPAAPVDTAPARAEHPLVFIRSSRG